ncbi:hypothetical protein HBH56_069390 [Parastagonospora nodorum]|uniref:Uncharacterized protein n=2 Tax=Phaeosphaeria nodorum (strain SN15 / ATCC MYA-4574 / FGSC 10173) TaxID=321614 RepID=A0A7U2HX38_PHANO|nr:hypothetical protein SNOG_03796 [Parastagonospora nodorum SN15]KAH3916145.1 hypothetical protein HBH56_069390 [Parastagonospora nodorum]EAT89001.1 hypothetical protein SNOG_03796 [Parastagonospora nodorum SN15]KAH3932784.1 hypothetical protein HBH54_078730 [Parastagonospora nodorum]KAH3955036.1 hypothetical protein HBH53_015630 [Parastagonospora nodorum]KAH3986165.1 hypothetical protein HBH52_046790 [Parastagonospora nodorum]
MNASATIRASYIRQTRMSFAPPPRPLSIPSTINDLAPRPAQSDKLASVQVINHIEYREQCFSERTTSHIHFDLEKNADTDQAYIDDRYLEFEPPFKIKLKKLFTTFPYRDPIYLVALIFLLGSVDLVMNAFFDLLPRAIPSTAFETEETVAVPTTVLVGSIFFFAAGILDTFGALNADAGTLVTSKTDPNRVVFKPALLGSAEFQWLPSKKKVLDLTLNNLAFQAGLIVLFGGVVFMFAGIVDFPGVVREEGNPSFGLIVFGPQVIHGALFFVANVMLAVSEQDSWFRPKFWDVDWQGAFLNAVGGFGFMVAGLFLFQRDEKNAGVAALIGSWAFLMGSASRLWVVMEVW